MQTKSITDQLGEYYGYPSCCIEAFSPNGEVILWMERDRVVIDATETFPGCGFLPCNACAKRVVKGELTLDQLIVNRKHPLPFPNFDWEITNKDLGID